MQMFIRLVSKRVHGFLFDAYFLKSVFVTLSRTFL